VKISLRARFHLLMLPLIIVVLVLVYVLNMPYRLMKDLLIDVRHDVEQIMEAETFLRLVHRQQNELLHGITSGAAGPHEGRSSGFHKGAERALRRWRQAFAEATFPEPVRMGLSANLQTVASSFNQISALTGSAMRLAGEGKGREALLQHDRIEDIIAGIIVPVSEGVVRELRGEVGRNIPFIMGSFEHTAFVRSGVAGAMETVERELGHTATVQRFMRLVFGGYQEVFGIVTGRPLSLDHRRETYRKELRGLMDRWALDVSLAGAEEKERIEKVFREGQRTVERLEATGRRVELLSGQGRKDEARELVLKDVDAADPPFLGAMDEYLGHEAAEIGEALERAYRDISAVQMVIASLSGAVLLLWAVIIAAMSRGVIGPVVRLRHAAARLGEGDFGAPVGRPPSGEVGELVAAFDEMRVKLKAAIEDLAEEVVSRKRTEAEKEKIIAELRKALAEVKTLSGLLPICASCKKIRDDKGYWTQVETYVTDHTMAEFSHGLCPDCARKMYSDLAKLKGESAGRQE